ncbi:phage tail spike protein [Shouchella clausii]|uniref:phage tail spike protein n=1 Tax=Shouchella TaxID=2893057 RepID=UPI0004E7A445|nr:MULTISPECIES: phage tail spike protein [Shouchella]ALA51900.1 Phage minor structural protein [Shouchella clausii]MBU3232073.1 phage tail protein [Shouchella clausii]MBU3264363.1 phage tail protein [Shouchella clausii]MBU3508758.1 phage tail protein [Shouchella clausii]MBU3535962.1 phage tail protein [Shouchella clausii]
MNVFIFDKHETCRAVLDERHLIEAVHTEQLNNAHSFEFTILADCDHALEIVEGQQVAFYDVDGDFQLFEIVVVEDRHGDAAYKTVICEHAVNELLDEPIEHIQFHRTNARQALSSILARTRWQPGVVAELGEAPVEFGQTNAKYCVAELLNTFKGELRCRVTIAGSKITGRYIDILSRRGADTGKRFEYRKDLTEIERTIDMSSVKTAIRAYGKPTEDENGDQGKPITFKEIEWSKAKGDPIDKPKGQDWLGDEQARALWGRGDYEGKRHRFGILEELDEDNPVRLLEQTYEYLQTVCTPLVHYSGKVVDLFRLSNFEHERIQLGDTAAVLDEDIYPVIQEKTRVIELKRDLLDPSNDEVVLGEFLPLFSSPNQEVERVLAKVKENSHVWDRAGRPIQPNSYPDIVPEIPANVTATGLYAAVMVEWDFSHLDTYIAGYEVYASEVQGFAGSPETLVYRGIGNTYSFHGEPNKQYYFRVRAFNYYERYSPLSEEVSATTARIVSEDIFFGEDLAAKLRELSKEAQIIADGSINLDQLEESVREQLQQDAKQYTDEEIKAVTEQINSELAEKAGLEYVDGKFQFTDGKLAELDSITDNLTREVGDINGTVSNIATNVDVIEGELSATASRLTNIDGKLSAQEADIRANADAISARITKDEFEDTTGQLSSQIGELELTASGLRTDFGELSKTVEGVSEKQSNFETTINGLKADVSNVETRVDNNAGAITNVSSRTSQLELRADRFSTTISELSHVATTGDNIIPDGSFEGGGLGWHGPGEIVDDAYSGKKALEFKGGSSPRTRSQSVTNPVAVVPGHTYRISYWYKTSADANGVRDNQKLRFGNADTGTLVTDWGWDGAQTEWRQIKGTWKCPSNVKALSVSMVTNHSVGWVRVDDIEVVDVSEVTNLQTSIDQNAREISLVASDTSALGNRMSQAESKLSVQADQINARVEKNGVIAAINLSSEGVRIDGAKTRITGQTLIDNGVIKTAHIGEAAVGTAAIANASISKAKLQNAIIGTAQIENGAITNAKIGNGQIDNAKIANATITNAKISDISAAKITSGTLDAANIMVRAMNGSMAVQMDADGFKAFDSNARNRILIGIRNFNGQGSDPALVRFFDPGGKNMGYVGANTNDTFTIYSASSTFIDSVDRIISRSGEFRFDPMRGSTGSRYWVMGRGNTSSKSGLHPTFRPDTSGWGLVGMSNFRLWEVWTNNMHYFTMHKISSRNVKENIEPLDLDYFARLIDQVELMSYHYKTPDRNGAYVRPNYGPISEDLPEEFRTPSDEGPALSMDDFIAGILAKVKVQDRIMKEQANAIKEIQKQVNALKGGR